MPVGGDAESQQPKRSRQPVSFADVPASERGRLHWRAIVRVGPKLDASRGHQPLAWHLAECANPEQPDAHCEVGRLLMASDGNPDGHCEIDGTCPRCAGSSVASEAADESAPTAVGGADAE